MASNIIVVQNIIIEDVVICYKVYAANGKQLGSIEQADDGFYYFWPELEPGHWTTELLKSIALHLDILNAPHQTQINQYFNDQTLQSSNPANPV